MTSRTIQVRAPAKINWTLEVVGKRADGYHEVRTILQTIDLADAIELRRRDGLALSVDGAAAELCRAWNDAPETNLAFRAATLVRERAGVAAGVEIRLSKRIPVAAGLGGGSSNAAAVLRGLRELWGPGISDQELAQIGAELGSDVPFFLRGGTALASGRGEVIEPLPDVEARWLDIARPRGVPRLDKTAAMYAALTPEHYTDGTLTERLAERIRRGEAVRAEDTYNVFERVIGDVDVECAQALEAFRSLGVRAAHLCGSGPAVFFVASDDGETRASTRFSDLDYELDHVCTLGAAEATTISETP